MIRFGGTHAITSRPLSDVGVVVVILLGGGIIGEIMKIKLSHTYDDIISLDNLLSAWQEFVKGKRHKKDVQEFAFNLMDNIIALHEDLLVKRYTHSPYKAFNISDPKPRNIHKAVVSDRILHHAIYLQLHTFFDRTFVADSYSCRLNKGTHRALSRFRDFSRKVSKNNTRTCWVLKCDIRKFFASINHEILIEIIKQYVPEPDIIWLISQIIRRFESTGPDVGLPLGNLTSQLLVNIYMNEFDQFMKHKVKARYYLRYADDFVIMSENKEYLEDVLKQIDIFLFSQLKLNLHPDKVSIKTLVSGVDFLGWVHFPTHRVLRTSTKRRMFKKLANLENNLATFASYRGMLGWGNGHKIEQKISNLCYNLPNET